MSKRNKELTPIDAAKYLNVHVQTLRNWIAAGTAPPHYRSPGGRITFKESDLKTYRESQRVEPTEVSNGG